MNSLRQTLLPITTKLSYFLLIVFISFTWVVESHGAGKEELVYTLNKGDNLWNLTERYLDGGVKHWESLVKLNNITDPTNMRPGTTIRIPLGWLKIDPAPVVVRDIYGKVQYIEARQTDPKELTSGTVLHGGDQVVVGKDSNVVLEFTDSSTLFLGSGSQMELLKTEKFSDSGLADSKVEIRRGRSEIKVKTKNSRFQINTPSASTTVRGTDFRVAVDEADPKLSKVEVLGGGVKVSGAKRAQKVMAGRGTTVVQGQPPTPPVKLLAQPKIVSPPQYSRKLPVDIKWDKIDGATGYRVLIRKNEGEQTLLFDKVIQTPRINTSKLEDGKYIIGVRAIDAKGLEGKDATYDFELDARPLPPMAISPMPKETVRKDLPQFEWSTPQEEGAIYHFQLSENSDLSTPLVDKNDFSDTRYNPEQLTPGTYYWRLATLAGGEEGPFSMVYTFTLRPSPGAPEIAAREGEGTITLAWPPGTEGQQYKVQLAKDSEFKELLSDELLQESSWTMERPEEKSFFRVRVIDVDGFEGDWSPPQQIDPPPHPWYYYLSPFVPIAIGVLFL